MAWNDSGNKDNPWQRKPEQGPPDLDEVVRNLQRKFRGLFGRGGPRPVGGGGGGGVGAASPLNGALLGGIALVVWGLTGFYVVDAAERAVITRFGKYVETTQPGLRWHLPWPVERKTIVNIAEFQSFADRTRMLTLDEALVDINLAVQYRRADPVEFTFNLRDPEKTLEEVSESAIREIIGRSKLDFVIEAGRQEISQNTRALIQRTLASYKTGIEVISVNLQDVSVPDQVAPSQKDAIKAREDKERLDLEARAYANDILPRARGNAARQLEESLAYRQRIVAEAEGESARFSQLVAEYERAPAVTRQRLYLETMEHVLGSSNKVLIDGKSGNMVYLPLDKLLEQRNAAPRNASASTGPAPSVTAHRSP